MELDSDGASHTTARGRNLKSTVSEVALMVCFLFLYVGEIPPDVNEVHYLTKARYVWDPSYCARDLFVTSPGAQPLFVSLFGWMTSAWGFSIAAWIGRGIAWLFLATGWLKLAQAFQLPWGMGLLSLALASGLNESLHMAGEWFVGGIEAKSIAYGFVVWALAFLIDQRAGWSLICLSCAIAFHPLVGGWCFLAMGFASVANQRYFSSQPTRNALILGTFILFAAILISIVPLIQYDAGTDAATKSLAHRLYVYTRLPHHLVPHAMRPIRVYRFAALITIWTILTFLCRFSTPLRILHWTTLGTLAIALCGWAIDLITLQNQDLGATFLRFYWFRSADVFVAWSVALGLTSVVHELIREKKRRGQVALIMLILLASCITLDQIVDRNQDLRPPADRQGAFGFDLNAEQHAACYANWRDVCDWIRTNTEKDALFLTPLKSQTFRWYAERAEFINWKDMPQNAAGILEWSNRRQAIDELGLYKDDRFIQVQEVMDFAQSHDIDYVLVVRHGLTHFWDVPWVYQNSWFSLVKVGPEALQDGN